LSDTFRRLTPWLGELRNHAIAARRPAQGIEEFRSQRQLELAPVAAICRQEMLEAAQRVDRQIIVGTGTAIAVPDDEGSVTARPVGHLRSPDGDAREGDGRQGPPHRGAYHLDRQIEADPARQMGRADSSGDKNGIRFDVAIAGRHPSDLAVDGLQARHRRALADLRAGPARLPRNGMRCNDRLGIGVARRIQPRAPVALHLRDERADLRRVDTAAVEPVGNGVGQPDGYALFILVGFGRHEDAGDFKFRGRGSQPLGQVMPDAVGLARQRNFPLVPPLLTHEAPGPARLLGSDLSSFQHDDLYATLGQPKSGRAADDASADDDDIG
jgi:hypothetical protein